MEKQNLEREEKRDSNIECLRIIAMLLIIAHHFSVHGKISFSTSAICINKFWLQFLQMGGKIGVNIFILISGYFLINAQKIKISKILKLWLQIFMYSTGIYIIFVIIGNVPFELNEIKKHFSNNFFTLVVCKFIFCIIFNISIFK